MPHYLIQAAYSPEAMAALTKNPQNRFEVIQGLLKNMGGRLEAGYFCFGEYDVAMIVELPDNTAAASLAIGVAGTGSLKSLKTTPLLTADEGLAAMQGAGRLDYQPPG